MEKSGIKLTRPAKPDWAHGILLTDWTLKAWQLDPSDSILVCFITHWADLIITRLTLGPFMEVPFR